MFCPQLQLPVYKNYLNQVPAKDNSWLNFEPRSDFDLKLFMLVKRCFT